MDKEAKGCGPEGCGQGGSQRRPEVLPPNKASQIGHVLGVMSGKGGVGKSSVSALLAVALRRRGHEVGIMDADITGPSIPKIFGLVDRPEQFERFVLPVRSLSGIKVMSVNLLLTREDEPVIWRGPILAGAVRQFWTDVAWGQLDYLIVDMPPGTGDIPLTVMQQLPLEGMVIVSSPQDLAMMVVRKAINMARLADVPILGLVENMSYLTCPHCRQDLFPFGRSNVAEAAGENGLRVLAVLPVDGKLVELSDAGRIEDYDGAALVALAPLVEAVEKMGAKAPA